MSNYTFLEDEDFNLKQNIFYQYNAKIMPRVGAMVYFRYQQMTKSFGEGLAQAVVDTIKSLNGHHAKSTVRYRRWAISKYDLTAKENEAMYLSGKLIKNMVLVIRKPANSYTATAVFMFNGKHNVPYHGHAYNEATGKFKSKAGYKFLDNRTLFHILEYKYVQKYSSLPFSKMVELKYTEEAGKYDSVEDYQSYSDEAVMRTMTRNSQQRLGGRTHAGVNKHTVVMGEMGTRTSAYRKKRSNVSRERQSFIERNSLANLGKDMEELRKQTKKSNVMYVYRFSVGQYDEDISYKCMTPESVDWRSIMSYTTTLSYERTRYT